MRRYLAGGLSVATAIVVGLPLRAVVATLLVVAAIDAMRALHDAES